MPRAKQPADIEIAALKKKVVAQANLMQAGKGTPWEDRGSLGTVPALFITCIRALTAPGKLWDDIRRPETTNDVRAFAMWCGVLAGISWVVHSLFWCLVYTGYGPHDGVPPLLITEGPRYSIIWQTWALGAGLQMACAIGGTLLLLNLANQLYQKMLPHTSAAHVPPSLTYNVIGYSLGVAVLSWIPLFGWLIAILWLMGLLIYASPRRLGQNAGTAVVSGIITIFVATVVAFGAYFAGAYGWDAVTGTAVQYTPPPPKIPT